MRLVLLLAAAALPLSALAAVLVLLRLQRQEKAAELRKVTPEEKAAKDRQRWSAWLQRYGRRLQAEANGGGSQEERASIMAATNPRCDDGSVCQPSAGGH